MTAASPFPNTADPLGPVVGPIYIPERGTHIPAHYVRSPHREPESVIVKRGGVPLLGTDKEPFTVAQVAPERRWAILEDGELYDQTTFTEMFLQTVLEFYDVLRNNGSPQAAFQGDLRSHPQPAVHEYVAFTIDPEDPRHLMHIGYDRHAKGDSADHFFDTEGEQIAGKRIDHLCAAYNDRKLRGTLTKAEISEVQAHLGVESGSSDEIATKLELLTELKDAGDLTDAQYIAKVAALTGASPTVEMSEPEPAHAPEPPQEAEYTATSLCGTKTTTAPTKQRAEFGIRAHQRVCADCKALAPKEEDTT